MNGLLNEIEVLLVDKEDVGEVACDPRDVDQGEDNPGNLQSGASGQAKNGGAYFSDVPGSIQDPIAVPGSCEELEQQSDLG